SFECCLRLLGDGVSWSTVVEEGELVDSAGFGATTSSIGAMTSRAGGSTLSGGLDSIVHQIHEGTVDQEVCHVKPHMVSFRDEVVQWNNFGCNMR
nr:hypothetical protein [Tanacetum cinerariifolium]